MALQSLFGDEIPFEWSTESALLLAAVGAAAALLCWCVFRLVARPRPKLPYPPGHWLMGNVLEFPNIQKGEFLDDKFREWSQEYGPVFSIRIPVLVGRMIIVADPDTAKYIMITNSKVHYDYQEL